MNKTKRLYVITGPIGAGKSTLLPIIIDRFSIDYTEYVSRDVYFDNEFNYLGDDYPLRDKLAKQKALRVLHEYMDAEKNIVWETVAAMEDRITLLKEFKQSGYYISVFFVSVSNVAVCQERVRVRQQTKGYDIPGAKVAKRYNDSYIYLEKLKELVNELWIVENSSSINEIEFKKAK